MINEKGTLSINSENIMPIIKKWLYSDEDIFLRELISNAVDAIRKLQKLRAFGDAPNTDEPYRVDVIVSASDGTIRVCDNGIGMTADEIKKYINQIAFSGASEFAAKYSDKMDKDEIIGHFGLGFYSSFMVAERVSIDSLSYQENATPVRWESDGTNSFELTDGTRETIGTTITLFVTEDCKQYLEEYTLRGIIRKYCAFMPVEIYVSDADKPVEEAGAEIETEEASDIPEEETPDVKETPINDTNPLWAREPKSITDEEYRAFYHKVFTDYNEPLFWIHLNIDYPFRLKGILYFPKLNHELEYVEGQVKLFNNQVFVADNIKEVIPEFLLTLKGMIDCPDLPLNVSRSFLQNDANVRKMSGYVTRKVAEKLVELFTDDREKFNSYWDDLAPFVKYGVIRERDFYDRIKDILLFKTIDGAYLTTTEYLAACEGKTNSTIIYVTDEQQQAQYISLLREQGIPAVLLTQRIDNPYMSYVESYNTDVHFARVDSEIAETLKSGAETQVEATTAIEGLFAPVIEGTNLKISAQNLKNDRVSAMILLSEQSRRMEEMSKQFGAMGLGMFPTEQTLVINENNTLVQKLIELDKRGNCAETVDLLRRHILELAQLAHKPLDQNQMMNFIEQSNRIMEALAKAAQ